MSKCKEQEHEHEHEQGVGEGAGFAALTRGALMPSLRTSMSQDHYRDYIGRKFIALSVVLTLVFWAGFTWLLMPFVPAESLHWQVVFGGFTAACLAGVFFLATHMFQLVLQEQRAARRGRRA